MLKRIYVDNFRCLVNFELRLDELTLLLGRNGCGKSTVFETLVRLQRFLSGERVTQIFPADALTRWDRRLLQSFEFELEIATESYTYKLAIEHQEGGKTPRVAKEELLLGAMPLFSSEQGHVQLYRDDGSKGPGYPFDWTQSGVAAVMPHPTNTHLSRFRDRVSRFLVVALQPAQMTSETVSEAMLLAPDGSNFASWYRYLVQEHQGQVFELVEHLRQIVPEFYAFRLVQAGSKNRVLEVGFAAEQGADKPRYYRFHELSDGQRALITLYTMLFAGPEAGYLLFIDEPDNYIALAELQPWLMGLRDACGESVAQAVLISHHPELIDYLGADSLWFERDPEAPARILGQPTVDDSGLPLSKLIARGWVP